MVNQNVFTVLCRQYGKQKFIVRVAGSQIRKFERVRRKLDAGYFLEEIDEEIELAAQAGKLRWYTASDDLERLASQQEAWRMQARVEIARGVMEFLGPMVYHRDSAMRLGCSVNRYVNCMVALMEEVWEEHGIYNWMIILPKTMELVFTEACALGARRDAVDQANELEEKGDKGARERIIPPADAAWEHAHQALAANITSI